MRASGSTYRNEAPYLHDSCVSCLTSSNFHPLWFKKVSLTLFGFIFFILLSWHSALNKLLMKFMPDLVFKLVRYLLAACMQSWWSVRRQSYFDLDCHRPSGYHRSVLACARPQCFLNFLHESIRLFTCMPPGSKVVIFEYNECVSSKV
jgi:hypothetical protein